MTVNIQSKEVLARLLATENISVEHRNVGTASFDVKSRNLVLPLWDDMQNFTYDHLVGHEVGHALYTDADMWGSAIQKHGKNFKGFYNIVEDARIEKKIQRVYPGLKTSFVKSYKKMLADGFFGKSEDEINNFKLIDRINVYFKCGMSTPVDFAKDEKKWLDIISKIETQEEAEKVALELFNLAKEELEQEQQAQKELEEDMQDGSDDNDFDFDNGDMGDDDYSDAEDGDDSFEESDEEGETESVSQSVSESEDDSDKKEETTVQAISDDITAGSSTALDPNAPIAITEEALENNIQKEYSQETDSNIVNMYLNLNAKYHDDIVWDYKKVLSFARSDTISAGTKMYKDFQRNNKKTINYLVKEFEMKKKASEYKRATVSKTGVIDTLKMNNHKFSDDIFKKMTVVPDGKNHGLVMFIDWSGSMASQLSNTVDQLINLVSFCRQVQIPFQVYAFSDNDKGMSTSSKERPDISQFKVGETLHGDNYHLLQFFDDKMTRREFQEMCALTLAVGKFWENRYRFDNRYGTYSVDYKLWLSGTPLNDAIISAHHLVAKFKKIKRLDIVNTVFLTDGEGFYCHYKNDNHVKTYLGYGVDKLIIQNPANKKQYRINNENTSWYSISGQQITKTLIKSLRDHTDGNVIGFHILPNRKPSALQALPKVLDYSQKEKVFAEMKAYKFATITTNGYTKQFTILGNDLQTSNGAIDVSETATTAQIRNAFKKANKGKKESRVMLSKFIDLVA